MMNNPIVENHYSTNPASMILDKLSLGCHSNPCDSLDVWGWLWWTHKNDPGTLRKICAWSGKSCKTWGKCQHQDVWNSVLGGAKFGVAAYAKIPPRFSPVSSSTWGHLYTPNWVDLFLHVVLFVVLIIVVIVVIDCPRANLFVIYSDGHRVRTFFGKKKNEIYTSGRVLTLTVRTSRNHRS